MFLESENTCSPTQNTFLRNFREFGVRSFGKTCSEWEHVSPTQNTFLRNLGSSEFGVSEKRVLSENTFFRLRTRFSEIFGVRSSEFRKNVFWVRTRFSDSEHVSPKFRELGVLEKRVLSENRFLRLRTRFPDSEHVFPKFKEFGVRSFGKTCTEWEHVSPTPNTFLRNLGSSKFGVSEKRVLSVEHVFRLRTRFSETPNSEISEFLSFGKTCSHSEHVSPKLQNSVSPKFSEKRVLSFGKTCSTTQNTFLRLRTRFSLNFGSSEFRRNVFWLRTRFSETPEHRFSENFGETKFWVSKKRVLTQNTFLRNSELRFSGNLREFGVSEKRVLSENTFLRLRTRFSEIYGLRSS